VGVEKNIYIRNHIKEIIYSQEKIVIHFIDIAYSDDSRSILGEPSLPGGAERDSARISGQALGGAVNYSDFVPKNRFEKFLVAALPVKNRIIPVELPNPIHNNIGKI